MKVLVTGGAASGKSAWAEEKLLALTGNEQKYYIACMRRDSSAAERRIARHRALRSGKGFLTIEQDRHLSTLCDRVRGTSVLVESAGILLANTMFTAEGVDASCSETIIASIRQLAAACRNIVVVTDEIFSDGVTYDPVTEAYRDSLAAINRGLAADADLVVEVVCSYPVPIFEKGKAL